MGLPYSPEAVDDETITHTFWNQLVSNYAAIFDGSAFDDGTVKLKYGTVARYIRLHSGNTSQTITLIPGQPYLVIILNSDPDVKLGRVTQSGNVMAYTITKDGGGIFTPEVANAVLAAQGSGAWGSDDVRFIIIKLDNSASEWAELASIPYPGLSFADEEFLQASKVNKVIANVNSSKTTMRTLDVESLSVASNTTTSMIPLGYANADEVTTPATINTEIIVSDTTFDITENLESCLVMISVSADYLFTSNDFYPDRVDVRDSESNVVATQDFTYFSNGSGETYSEPCNLLLSGLAEDEYTVELVYYLQGSGSHAVNTAYPGITNITVMAFGA